MTRIPASASVALAAMLPACAVALGLGEIEPQSYLNQPLVAEIPVFSEVPGEMAGLNVTLASRETFDQYGLPRPALLSDLRFSVVEGPQGGTIRVSSSRPVAEPFLTLLIEVRWAQGRLLREFTVLLDPPDFAGALTSQPLPAPAPVAAAEVAPVVPPAEVATPAAEPQLPAASVPQARQPAPPAEADVGGSHTVARNETLWGIADRYRPSTADINQMMVAIYRANPEAFAGNINRLRAGAVLRIPEMTAAERLTRREAAAEVSQQTRAWQAGAAPSAEAARLELVPPPEPAPAAASVPPASATATADPDALRSRLEESQRLLAVKDAELKALRDRVAALEEQSGESVGAVPAESRPAPAAEETPVEEQAATIQAPEAESAAPAPRTPPAEPGRRPGGGVLGAIGGLLTSVWLWAAAAVVLVVALLVARRRSGAEEPEVRIPLPTRRSEGAAAQPVTADSTMIVHEEPARSTGRLERRAVPRGGDEETALEKTISTEGPVNLDQSDPLAEADFHMAYGLYDQAADLLTAAVGREPGRRDLRLKLLDVYFVWENRDGFLKEARALLQRIGGESDPDWKRVVIMGKQLCPNDSLFTGAAGAAGDIVDLNLAGDGGGGVDLEISGDSGILDFTIDPEFSGQADSGDVTSIAEPTWRGASTAQTQEIPTIEVPAIDTGVTRETPTIENPALNSTLETPTIETRAGESTLETPTLETAAAREHPGATARLPALDETQERADETAEIDLEDLGLDLAGLDEAARDMATGLHEAMPEESADLDFDLSEAVAPEGEDSTAEMEKGEGLSHLTNAFSKSEAASRSTATPEDTVEQPRAGAPGDDTVMSATSGDLLALNLDLAPGAGAGEDDQLDLTSTSMRPVGLRGPGDATMTEVGTKLDLARAYIDMGDPDGARSILNEVVEEGDLDQQQEARQLLDDLDG